MTGEYADPATRNSGSRRPEIQALRAIGVLLVVTYHLWPAAVSGGFVGVDVFFVVSGFLITSLLVGEIERTGRLSLSAFWARRARRILPAALLTLLVCAAVTIAVVPMNLWEPFLGDIRASAAYVQNWHLAATSVDYFAAAEAPSPVQHFWSLSMEEQFYLVWPVILLLAAAGRGPRTRRRWLLGALVVATVGSLGFGLYYTSTQPVVAYFSLPARAWEFSVGGLLAMWPRIGRPSSTWRAALSWAGLAGVLAAGLLFDGGTRLPGLAALLPALGAAAVIAAGAPTVRWAPTPLLSLRPLQFVGDISYSVYLWHWPLLILAPYVLGAAPHAAARAAILGVALLVGWMSKVVVEDPVRFAPWLTRHRPRRTLALAAAATGVVLAINANGVSRERSAVAQAERTTDRVVAHRPRCFGAAARDPLHPCSNPRLRLLVVPTPLEARHRKNAPCSSIVRRGRLQVCSFGVPESAARARIGLVGDSHASAFRAAVAVVARAERWSGVSITRSSCALTMTPSSEPPPYGARCMQWRAQVLEWLRQHRDIRTVFLAENAPDVHDDGGASGFATAMAGYIAAWRALPASVRHVIVVRDVPHDLRTTPDCVTRAIAKKRPAGTACAIARRVALDPDPAADAVAAAHMRRVQELDLTRYFCGARTCLPVIGGVLVHRNETHLTAVFATTLGPYVLRRVRRMLPGADPLFHHRATARTSSA